LTITACRFGDSFRPAAMECRLSPGATPPGTPYHPAASLHRVRACAVKRTNAPTNKAFPGKALPFPLLVLPFARPGRQPPGPFRRAFPLTKSQRRPPCGTVRSALTRLLVGLPILATLPGDASGRRFRRWGCSTSDDRARSGVSCRGYDDSPRCTPGFTVVVLFLTVLFLLCLPL